MMSAIKRQTRAAEYRELAEKSAALAAASPLAHVREKHETAALRWSVLAAADERPRELVTALFATDGA